MNAFDIEFVKDNKKILIPELIKLYFEYCPESTTDRDLMTMFCIYNTVKEAGLLPEVVEIIQEYEERFRVK